MIIASRDKIPKNHVENSDANASIVLYLIKTMSNVYYCRYVTYMKIAFKEDFIGFVDSHESNYDDIMIYDGTSINLMIFWTNNFCLNSNQK